MNHLNPIIIFDMGETLLGAPFPPPGGVRDPWRVREGVKLPVSSLIIRFKKFQQLDESFEPNKHF